MNDKAPPVLRGVELVCPKCNCLIARRDLGFVKFEDDTWHAQTTGSCVKCAQKVEFHLKVNQDGRVYVPVPGKTTGEPDWMTFGHISFVTGEIITC